MLNQEQMIAEIAREVVARIRVQMQQPAPAATLVERVPVAGEDGVFATVNDAVNAAYHAQKQIGAMSLEDRGRIISIIRRICTERAEELGPMELQETHVGRVDHKIQKLKNIRYVLGVEAMRSDARADKSGLCVIERAPWGVIGMALPVTHSVPTMAGNCINVVAAGNTAVFAPHPSGAKVAKYALQLFNREIERELGIQNTCRGLGHLIEWDGHVFHCTPVQG
jgi:aldehyde dehydrogenase